MELDTFQNMMHKMPQGRGGFRQSIAVFHFKLYQVEGEKILYCVTGTLLCLGGKMLKVFLQRLRGNYVLKSGYYPELNCANS